MDTFCTSPCISHSYAHVIWGLTPYPRSLILLCCKHPPEQRKSHNFLRSYNSEDLVCKSFRVFGPISWSTFGCFHESFVGIFKFHELSKLSWTAEPYAVSTFRMVKKSWLHRPILNRWSTVGLEESTSRNRNIDRMKSMVVPVNECATGCAAGFLEPFFLKFRLRRFWWSCWFSICGFSRTLF